MVEPLSLSQLRLRRLGNWLEQYQFHAIEHLPKKENLILKVFSKCEILTKAFLTKQGKTISSQGFRQGNKWTTFLDKLNSSDDQSMLSTYLYKISVQELIMKEKNYQPFWTPAYKELSEKLLLPTTDSASSSTVWARSQFLEEKSPFLKIHTTKHRISNSQPISCPSMCSPAVKWDKGTTEPAKLRTIKIRLFPTRKQKKKLDEFIDTSRYVYNKTIEKINQGVKANHHILRDMLVTANTKKGDLYKEFDDHIKDLKKQIKNSDDEDEIEDIKQVIEDLKEDMKQALKKVNCVKNSEIKDFELNTPKDVRDNAIRRVLDARKAAFTNLKNGNIKHFRMKFKKKTEPVQTVVFSSKNITINNGKVIILPTLLKSCKVRSVFKMSKRNTKKYKNLVIDNEVDVCRKKGEYFMHVCVKPKVAAKEKPFKSIGGTDLGLRTFATVHTHTIDGKTTTVTEYVHRVDILRKLNQKIKGLKKRKVYYRKKQYNKIEKKKIDLVDSLHWDVINDMLKKNDVMYLGDIKSHDIVKGGKNKILNTDFNDLKLYTFKLRYRYKADLRKKKLFMIPEHYTTKCCSSCGTLNNYVGKKKIFSCVNKECGLVAGRDINAPKNIKMKGMLS